MSGVAHTVLLWLNSDSVAGVYALALEECILNLQVITCTELDEAREALRKNPKACVVVEASIEGALAGLLAERTASAPLAPFIILDSDSAPLPEPFDSAGVVVIGSEPSLKELVARVEIAQKIGAAPSRLCKISPSRLVARQEKLHADVYLKKGDATFQKVFQKGDFFGTAELEGLREKEEFDFLYLHRHDFLDATDEALSKARGYFRNLQRLGRKPLLQRGGFRNRQDILILRGFERLFLITLAAVAILYILQFSLNRPLELPFVNLGPGAFCINVWLILAFLLPWTFVFDVRAVAVGSIALATGFAWLNYRKILELGKPIGIFDFQNVHFSKVLFQYVGLREALSLIILFCIPLCLRFLVNRYWRGDRARSVAYYYFTALTVHFGAFLLFVCFEPFRADSFLLKRFPPLPDQVEFALRDGYVLSRLLGMKFMGVFHTDHYSPEIVKEILESSSLKEAPTTHRRRNIVLVLMESFRDYSLDGILFNEEVLPFYRHLKENSKVGRFYSPTIGGGTANVEFEVLTGIPMAFLPAGSIVHEQYLDHGVPSVAGRLKREGYETIAVHNNFGGNYKRKRVLPFLGFGQFLDDKDLIVDYGSVKRFV